MIRAIVGAFLGAAAAAAALVIITSVRPGIALEFVTDPPRAVASGLYSAERVSGESFAWTSPLATLTFRDLDRSGDWRCVVRARGARPGGVPDATVAFSIDGTTLETRTLGNEYQQVELRAAARSGAGSLTLGLSTTPPYVPGPADPRELGVQLDRVECQPESARFVRPTHASLHAALITGGLFGVLFAVLLGAIPASGAIVVFATGIALMLNTGTAAFSRSYLDWYPPLAISIVVVSLLGRAVERFFRLKADATRHHGRRSATGFALAFTAGALFLKIAALLHPSKDLVDAVFHAHRLTWVLEGRYYFTQPMPGGVQFPYAIALYVAAAPFASLTADHVALLRIVVSVAEAAAALLIFVAVLRTWQDPLAAATALALYHLAPLAYVVVGNANLTYAFGQSMAAIAISLAVLNISTPRRAAVMAALFVVAAAAFLAHVGVFPVLAVTLVITGVLFAWQGAGSRKTGWVIAAVAIAAAVLAIAVYYVHFPEVYQTLGRVSASPEEAAASQPAVQRFATDARVARAATLALQAFGWPMLLLAAGGAVALHRKRDALTLAIAASLLTFLGFVLFRIAAPVDARLQRYADEFIERLCYATLPAVAVLAAGAASFAWRGGRAYKWIALALISAATLIGSDAWIRWIR